MRYSLKKIPEHLRPVAEKFLTLHGAPVYRLQAEGSENPDSLRLYWETDGSVFIFCWERRAVGTYWWLTGRDYVGDAPPLKINGGYHGSDPSEFGFSRMQQVCDFFATRFWESNAKDFVNPKLGGFK